MEVWKILLVQLHSIDSVNLTSGNSRLVNDVHFDLSLARWTCGLAGIHRHVRSSGLEVLGIAEAAKDLRRPIRIITPTRCMSSYQYCLKNIFINKSSHHLAPLQRVSHHEIPTIPWPDLGRLFSWLLCFRTHSLTIFI